MLMAILALAALAALFGLLLGYANQRFKVEGDPVVEQIDTLLPQTQCGQCGFPGCRPYAQAIATQEADINRCPPGGEATITALADLLDRDPKPLDSAREEKPKALAVIDENRCIGCTLCIQACPVDAILGAAKQLHTVIAAECTGCELCVPPCPVDCIEMVPVVTGLDTWKWPFPEEPISMILSPNPVAQVKGTSQQPPSVKIASLPPQELQ
jgi:Na+-translocating ferredoxin:NAD+ oxidoreductase subunit B